jgi:hypothetical protein
MSQSSMLQTNYRLFTLDEEGDTLLQHTGATYTHSDIQLHMPEDRMPSLHSRDNVKTRE